ncbi:MAG: phosphoenolpyruvate synthase [Candidatus Diapherotrites archaeon]
MEKTKEFILWFDQTGIEDVPLVGGKNASLGEMYRNLSSKGIAIPNGFCITASAYKHFLEKTGLNEKIKHELKGLNIHRVKELMERGEKIRTAILRSKMPEELEEAIENAYHHLGLQYGHNPDVAVRSSATAEDLPDASFAGQQETFLNVRGPRELLEAVKKCFASLFTNRAISYREDKGFDHSKVFLSVGVQKMVRSDIASSGVIFTIDTETGFQEAILINSSWGLGESVVQGAVTPDEFIVFKPTLRQGKKAVLSKKLGEKRTKIVYAHDSSKATKKIEVSEHERKKFTLSDEEILKLSSWALIIEEYYSSKAGKFKPMDIEFAKDGVTGNLFIVQARPETVQSQKNRNVLEEFVLKEKGRVIVKGESVGSKIGKGKVRVIKDASKIEEFKPGEILVTDMTDPDWEPIMKIASAIITNKGGRTCFSGDTKILTNKGFKTLKEIFDNKEELYTLSLNKNSLQIEWKKITASMKRSAELIEVSVSQTGKMKGNSLKITEDHKVPTFDGFNLVSKEMKEILSGKEMVLSVSKITELNECSEKDKRMAYLLGAINTDGSIYLSRTHGEVQFIQKPSPEKMDFINTVINYFSELFGKKMAVTEKKISQGYIREKQAFGSANAYRCYSKEIAIQFKEETQNLAQTILLSNREIALNFLAGVIDGDGSYSREKNKVNIYCSEKELLEAIIIACLKIESFPQVSTNRNIYNIQLVEGLNKIFLYTKRVKGHPLRKRQGTRFFSAKQLLKEVLEKVNYSGHAKVRFNKNLLISDKELDSYKKMLSLGEQKELEKILNSSLRMLRISPERELGIQDVYNITIEDNHNYFVFTERMTPVIVNNCHSAIVSRELGIPCIVGTGNGSEIIKTGQAVTVDCSQGSEGSVYDGMLEFEVKKINLSELPSTKTKIMMNVGNPDQAFDESLIPNDGVGLAREEFIISSYIKVHPLALLYPERVLDAREKKEIEELTHGYKDKRKFFIDKLAEGIALIGAAFHPKDVILRFSDFKTNEYAGLIGGKYFEPKEDNPMIGWRGASRYYDERYREGFQLECEAIKKARNEIGLTNVKVMVPFCRTLEEGRKVIEEMKKNGLVQGENGLEVYVMCEIPSNVILAEEFAGIFDGFSIGSNDLTQLTLGLDRDSQLVSHIYNERNDAVKRLIAQVIASAKKKGRKIGICGQAPSDFPDFAQFLVQEGIDSISLNPDTVIRTRLAIAEEEKKLGR